MGTERRPPRARPRGARPAAVAASPPAPPLPLRHPAVIAIHLLAALCVVLAVSSHLFENDMWQHLAVGRAIWTLHRVPTTQIWTWPTYGAPDVNYAWGFEVLVWPFWSAGGMAGLFVWRWLAALAAFLFAWGLARRLGARGLTAPVLLALATLCYRDRAFIRPEALAAVLIPFELWILETRRRGGPDRTLWLVAAQWVWANTHISWVFGFFFMGLYELDARLAGGRPAAPWWRRSLLPVMIASLLVSLLNPFGWATLLQPFDYLFVKRHSPLYQIIEELKPLSPAALIRTASPLLLAGWPLLLVARARRAGVDRVEAALCAAFTALAFSGIRFLGPYALVAAPFAARDLDAWLSARRGPAWIRRPVARLGAAAAAIAAIGGVGLIGEVEAGMWTRFGIDVEWGFIPAQCTEFMARHGIRGRGFNSFEVGGWMLHRFWPDSTRLPFIDIHQAGRPEDLEAYAAMYRTPAAWRRLDDRYRFPWALLWSAVQQNALDADSSFVPVFMEDAAVLYVRRDGPFAEVGRRFGYRLLPGGDATTAERVDQALRDPALAAALEGEFQRAIREARMHDVALSRLANLEAASGRFAAAKSHLEASSRRASQPRIHERLGICDLALGDPAGAVREFQRAWWVQGGSPRLALLLGNAWRTRGDLGKARGWYRRALRMDPGSAEAADSLAAIEGAQR